MHVKRSFYSTFEHALTVERTEEVACNLCRSAAYRRIGEEQGFEIRECSHCGLVYVSPQPVAEEIPRFYEAMYEDGEEDGAPRSLGLIEPHLAGIIARRRPEGGRLVDVGCGYGRLLKELRALPFELTGTEVSASALEVARARVPEAEFIQGTVDELELPPASKDVVISVAVLEHVKDPRAVLARLCSWLAPGGVLVIQVPYVQHFIRLKRYLPGVPVYFEAPRHLFDFSPRTLPRYFEELGLAEVRTDIGRPYSAHNALQTALIWSIKLPGYAIHALTGRVYPFAGSIVTHGVKRAG